MANTNQSLVTTKDFADRMFAAYLECLGKLFIERGELTWSLQKANDFLLRNHHDKTCAYISDRVGAEQTTVANSMKSMHKRAQLIG